MFWNFWRRKPDPTPSSEPDPATTPYGVPLGEVAALLRGGSLKVSIDGDTLFADHGAYRTRVKVLPPPADAESADPIRAIVRITTEVPEPIAAFIRADPCVLAATINRMSALGALTIDNSRIYVGARLTVFEEEDAWGRLHLPLIAFTVIGGVDAIVRGISAVALGENRKRGPSSWSAKDLRLVNEVLTEVCACSVDDSGFTAEFGLAPGHYSRMLGHTKTALFRIQLDQPHPAVGGGLFAFLQFPTEQRSEEAARKACARLNRLEMAGVDVPPHFGAWCPGVKETNVAYAMFLPNALHAAPGIALSAAIWSMHRAEWGVARLREMGLRP